jgi:hypothetical protein
MNQGKYSLQEKQIQLKKYKTTIVFKKNIKPILFLKQFFKYNSGWT